MPVQSSSPKSTRSVSGAFSTFRKSSQFVTKRPEALTKFQLTLFSSNMGLVHHVAHRFEWTGEDYEDLAQIGSIGLMVAVKKFQPGMGFAFSSYAIRCITGEIMHHLRDHGSLIKVPRAWREQLAKGKKLEAKGINPAEGLGITEDEWMMIREAHANQYHSSLEEVVVGEEESSEPTAPTDTPEIAWAKIRAKISHLPKIEYGIAELLVKGASHAEVAMKLKITMSEFNRRLQTVRISLEERQA